MLDITRATINLLENLKEENKIVILYNTTELLAEQIKLELLIYKPTIEINTVEYNNIEENSVYVTFTKKRYNVDMPYSIEVSSDGIRHCLKSKKGWF